jgi:hypothetical protein
MCGINLDYKKLLSCPCCGDINEAIMLIGDGTMLSHFWEYCAIKFKERDTEGTKNAVNNGMMSFMCGEIYPKYLRILKASLGYTINRKEVRVTKEVSLNINIYL